MLNHALPARSFNVANLATLGLVSVPSVMGGPMVEQPDGAYGRFCAVSVGKDAIARHWECMGMITTAPFQVIERFGVGHLIAHGRDATPCGAQARHP